MEQGDRRQTDRRATDRRQPELFSGGRRQAERRRFSRRKMAGAGILAMVALATGRSQGRQLVSPVESDPTIEVTADNFHLPAYDRASLEPLIEEAAAEHGLSPHLVRAVIQTESQFNPLAVSPVGAAGLMQLMPNTAKRVGIDNPFDPRENVFGGVKYLSMMMSRFKGNTALALAGYNAGPEKVKRHRGIPPYRETQGYVRKIQKLLADTDAAFSLPVVKKKPRRASLRASARKGAARSASVKRAAARPASKARKATAVKARTSSKRAALRTPAKATKKPVRKSTRRTRASLRG
jgi:hypothetical protein